MVPTIALAGNPNSGKTTLFNELTGSRQHVGNYPGVTVEKKEGTLVNNGYRMSVVDLPGTYSLTAYSLEEVVARDFLVNEKPEVVNDIVDASNLERNLYLAIQFLEMGLPVCIALNMVDVAQKRGIEIDAEKLSAFLGVPVIPTVARTGLGKKDLIATARRMAEEDRKQSLFEISYGDDLDRALAKMTPEIEIHHFLTETYPARWVALKYLENDKQILSKGHQKNSAFSEKLETIGKKVSTHLKATVNSYPEAMIADHRYGYINSIIKQGMVHRQHDQNRLYTSDKIDKIVTHRFLGPILMIAVLLGLYHFTFTYGEIPVGWFARFFGWVGDTENWY